MKANENKAYQIKDWSIHQHYRRGNKNYTTEMPWFKVYGRSLINDKDFMSLTPDQRDTLFMLWVVASQTDGILPSSDHIAFKIRKDLAVVDEHIQLFIDKNIFIEEYDEIKFNLENDTVEIFDQVTGEYYPFPEGSDYQIQQLDNMPKADREYWLKGIKEGTIAALYNDKKTKMDRDTALRFYDAYCTYKDISQDVPRTDKKR